MQSALVQRSYRASCPGCGAPVELRSARSTHAVCGFCRSTLLRQESGLAPAGQMAALFDDHSPLQCQATGRWQGQAFEVVGRLQYRGPAGPWSEWALLYADGASALLLEDHGAYVLAQVAQFEREPPPATALREGLRTVLTGQAFTVSSNEPVLVQAGEGELPAFAPPGTPFTRVTLRNEAGQVLWLLYGGERPIVFRGQAVGLPALRLQGLREASVREEQVRHLACPACGAPVVVQLASSRAATCSACHGVIDLTPGPDGERRHVTQDEPVPLLLPLGRVGRMSGVAWQVLGFRQREGHAPGEPQERFAWGEYLLYNHRRGFQFLACGPQGWHRIENLAGAPQLSPREQTATFTGREYRLAAHYEAHTVHVSGEFFWPVHRGQRSYIRRFARRGEGLLLQESGRRQQWVRLLPLRAANVARAFGLPSGSLDASEPPWLLRLLHWFAPV